MGTTGDLIQVPWTEGMDALYVFEGAEQLEKLYDKEHLYFLSTLKAWPDVMPSTEESFNILIALNDSNAGQLSARAIQTPSDDH